MELVHIVVFDGFMSLDVFGPAEVLSKAGFEVRLYSVEGLPVTSSTGVRMDCRDWASLEDVGILLIPGGIGTRTVVASSGFLSKLRDLAQRADHVLCVCTGSGLLAKTGLLDGRKATSNKLSWEWAVSQGDKVQWVRKARWIVDGKFHTSAGITAGIDMALGFVAERFGVERAREIAKYLEHVWQEDREVDPFA